MSFGGFLPLVPASSPWRRTERERCVALRRAAPAAVRQLVQQHVSDVLDAAFRHTPGAPCFAFYWPIRGEVGLLAAAARAITQAAPVPVPPPMPAAMNTT